MEKIIAYIIPIICGLTAANMYYIQPLVPFAQSALQIGYEQTSMLYSFSLAGNALSLLFLVPLGGFYNKKSIIILLYLTSFVALLVFYFSSYYPFLAICSMFIGIGTSALPLITAVFSKRENGHIIIGRIMGGVLLGILASRFVAGVLCEIWGWKSVYALSAMITCLCLFILKIIFPDEKQGHKASYIEILSSNINTIVMNKVVRFYSITGFSLMFVFSSFWNNISSYLTSAFHFNGYEIGLFSLAGVAGASSAYFSNVIFKIIPHGNRFLFSGCVISLMIVLFFHYSLAALILGTLLVDAFIQLIHVNNQITMYSLCRGNEARAASSYMTSFVIGGAVGGYLSSIVFINFSWTGVIVICILICFISMTMRLKN